MLCYCVDKPMPTASDYGIVFMPSCLCLLCRIHGGDKSLEDMFVKESTEAGLLQLFGHPLLGGLRVCIYNGLPDEAITALLSFMISFSSKYRK